MARSTNLFMHRTICQAYGMAAIFAGASATIVGTVATACGAPVMASEHDLSRAAGFFREARALSDRDGQKMWGLTMYGPMMFVEPQSRTIMANQADLEGKLKERNGVYIGSLPKNINVANTAVAWADVHWTMIMWPLPEDATDRQRLMAHELWHRIQGDLRLSSSDGRNAHLDTQDGRAFMQLEWRALAAALKAEGGTRRRAIEDALFFRAHRRSLFPESAGQEHALEMNEGLAEYTGVVLSESTRDNAERRAIVGWNMGPEKKTFVRSFAYASGPAYGVLLDVTAANWRNHLSAKSDFGAILEKALGISLSAELSSQVEHRAKRYDGDALFASEARREKERLARLAGYRVRFITGPILTIPLQNMNIQFNPGNLVPLDDLGTVYPNLRITDLWGVLEVENDALLASNWQTVFVTAPSLASGSKLNGDGWTLELKNGWQAKPGNRAGDFEIARTITP